MKLFFISILLVVATTQVALGSQPSNQTKINAKEELEKCTKACGSPDCFKEFHTGAAVAGRRFINNFVCVELFKHCLSTCRIDYKEVLKTQKSSTIQQNTSKQN